MSDLRVLSYPAHTRAVLLLGLPLIGGHLAQFAIGLTDTAMLGWYGAEALAAVTLGSTYFFVMFIFGSGFAWAVMPMVAEADAQDDQVQIRRVTRMGIWLSLLFSTIAMPMFWFSEEVLAALGQNETVSRTASSYLRVAGWGLPPAILVMVLKSYLAALERTQIVLWITVFAALCNAAVNYALIFGNWGAPELGVQGAAIASVTTQLVSLVGVVTYAVWVLPEHSLFQRFWRPDWDMFARVFRVGLPIGLTSLSEVGLFTASALMMGWLGTVPLAAHGIAVSLAGATFMIHLGLSNAATVRAANASGRKDAPHLVRGGKTVFAMSLTVAILISIVFVAMPVPLIDLFLAGDEPERDQIVSIGVGLLLMAALFQLVDGAQVIALGLLRGVQDTKVPMIIAVISYWVIGIPVSYLLGFTFGMDGVGVWFGLVVGLMAAGVMLSWRFFGVVVRAF